MEKRGGNLTGTATIREEAGEDTAIRDRRLMVA